MLVFSFIQSNHRQHYSLYLFLIIACLLLGITNAINAETEDNNENVIDEFTTKQLSKKLNDELTETSRTIILTTTTTTAANESSNTTEPSIFQKPQNMADVKRLGLAFVTLLAQAFLIVS